MEQEQKKEFTGVWIPKHIIEDESLSMTDRTIYAEINCFDVCYKSNAKLGERYGLKPNTISIVVSKLIKKGYVISLGMAEGRFRKLKAVTDKPNQRQGMKKIKGTLSEKSKAGCDKNQTIDNKEDNNKDKVTLLRKVSDLKKSQSKPKTKNPSFSVEETEIANEFDLPTPVKKKINPPRPVKVIAPTTLSEGAVTNKRLGLWLKISPQNTNLYGNKTERRALDELYEKYPEEIDFIVKVLPQTNALTKDEFFWKVFKPSALLKHIDAWKSEFKSKIVKLKKEAKHVEFCN
jgi:hypothetical protein